MSQLFVFPSSPSLMWPWKRPLFSIGMFNILGSKKGIESICDSLFKSPQPLGLSQPPQETGSLTEPRLKPRLCCVECGHTKRHLKGSFYQLLEVPSFIAFTLLMCDPTVSSELSFNDEWMLSLREWFFSASIGIVLFFKKILHFAVYIHSLNWAIRATLGYLTRLGWVIFCMCHLIQLGRILLRIIYMCSSGILLYNFMFWICWLSLVGW